VETLTAGLRVSHVWDLPVVSLEAAASLGGAFHRQSFETDGSAPARPLLGAFSGIDAAASVELGAGLALFAETGLESHLFAVERSATGSSELEASWAFVQRVGLSKLW
jgi:hypothetical protein